MNHSSGFTLVELMVTLVIAGLLLSLGLITMRGYIPKQRLLASVSTLEGLLQRAQSEATARSLWTCIKFRQEGKRIEAELHADKNHPDPRKSDTCGEADDILITKAFLKNDVVFPACENKNISFGCVIWFDSTGSPKKCDAGCPAPAAATKCKDADFEIVLSNPKLGSGTRAREIEVLSGGLIVTPKLGEFGTISDQKLWARAPNGVMSSTTYDCE